MAKPSIADEVQVLRFFEQGSIEKPEVLFRIVCEKMRERLRGDGDGNNGSRTASGSGKKRQPVPARTAQGAEVREPNPAQQADAALCALRGRTRLSLTRREVDPDNKPLHIQTYGVASLRKPHRRAARQPYSRQGLWMDTILASRQATA
jgi:hypothetical protein